MAAYLGSAVHRKVFRSGDHAIVARVVTLQAADNVAGHGRGEEWILPERLLPSPPPRIAKDVDVGRPECQPKVDAVYVFANGLVVFRACLDRNGGANILN